MPRQPNLVFILPDQLRAGDADCLPIYRRLDGELTREFLGSIHASHAEKKVAHIPLYNDEAFGQKGWQRTYPQSIHPTR